MCYTINVNRRGADQLPLKLPLKAVGSLAGGLLSHWSLSEGLFTDHPLSPYRVGGAPGTAWCSFSFSFLTTGKDL